MWLRPICTSNVETPVRLPRWRWESLRLPPSANPRHRWDQTLTEQASSSDSYDFFGKKKWTKTDWNGRLIGWSNWILGSCALSRVFFWFFSGCSRPFHLHQNLFNGQDVAPRWDVDTHHTTTTAATAATKKKNKQQCDIKTVFWASRHHILGRS